MMMMMMMSPMRIMIMNNDAADAGIRVPPCLVLSVACHAEFKHSLGRESANSFTRHVTAHG